MSLQLRNYRTVRHTIVSFCLERFTVDSLSSDLRNRTDNEHAGSDDVRSAAMAIAEVKSEGLDNWLGTTLSSATLGDTVALRGVVERGLAEVETLHLKYGVK